MINGLVLTIVGMLTVFAFLILMVLAMSVLRRLLERVMPAAAAEVALAIAVAHDARRRSQSKAGSRDGEVRRS